MARAGNPARAREAAVEIVRTLRAAAHTAYFAGGCVRDELLGLAPTDYDVATDAVPDRIRSLFPKTAEVGAAFGVVLVKAGSGREAPVIEVATFRSDGPYTDKRRPDAVTFSDEKSDAERRDFTINALFLDPLGAAQSPSIHGHVIDYVGGMGDLARKTLRAVGDPEKRLAEDHLRALRAARLAARLGLTIDPKTAAAIRKHASALSGVSRERIGDEVRKMMGHPLRAHAVERLGELTLDGPVLSEPCLNAPPRLTALLPEDSPFAVCLAAWALDRGLQPEPFPETRKRARTAVGDLVDHWRTALCLTNEETQAMTDALHGLALLQTRWASMAVAAQKRAAAAGWFPGALALLRITSPQSAASTEARVRELIGSPGGIAPPALLDGEDLIQAGFAPGPAFRRLLDSVYDAQLEGRVKSKAEAMELARGMGV